MVSSQLIRLSTTATQYSGIQLKNDPAVLAWETGNELQIKGQPFTNWTEEIAAFLKAGSIAFQVLPARRARGFVVEDLRSEWWKRARLACA